VEDCAPGQEEEEPPGCSRTDKCCVRPNAPLTRISSLSSHNTGRSFWGGPKAPALERRLCYDTQNRSGLLLLLPSLLWISSPAGPTDMAAGTKEIDLVFAVDCTGSMGVYIAVSLLVIPHPRTSRRNSTNTSCACDRRLSVPSRASSLRSLGRRGRMCASAS
jgi:hypothetical protein